jgi:microcystin-dependent protein
MSEISHSNWSEVPASNNAPPPNGAPEHHAASAVNDIQREVMANVKRFWGRVNPRYASTGSSNAYVVTPDATLAALATGETYAFRANHANSGAATLDWSDAGAIAIKKFTASGKVDLASGDIQNGQPVACVYDGTHLVMVSPSANTLTDATALALVPTGAVSPYAGTSEPTGWLFCYGQAVSRSTYAALFTAISTTYGSGDGSTTFNLPDLRGRVVAGQDDMGGTSANRLTDQTGGLNGDTLGATGGSETHTLTTAQIPSHSHNVSLDGGSTPSGAAVALAGASVTGSLATATAGSGNAHNNVQPTIILNYIIRT